MKKFAEKFEEVLCLLYYDGPLLSYYRDGLGRHFLVLWVDVIENDKEPGGDWVWYAMEFGIDDMAEYFKDELDLLSLMERAISIHECLNSFVSEENEAEGKPIRFADIPEDRKPKPDAFCEVPEAINHLK